MFKNFKILSSFEQDINIPSFMSKKRKNSDSASLPKKTITLLTDRVFEMQKNRVSNPPEELLYKEKIATRV